MLIMKNDIELGCYPLGGFSYVNQQRLNDLSSQFGIAGHEGSNELGHTHWTVKEVNLFETLKINGLWIN